MHASDSTAMVMACVDCNSNSGYHGILPTNQPTNHQPTHQARKEGGWEGKKEETNKQIKLFLCSNNFFVFKLPTSRVRQLLWWVLSTKSTHIMLQTCQ
jgi:hypothetical protein